MSGAVARRKTFHGITVGILMVRTYFRRLPGDMGHASTWDFPVQFRVVEEATPDGMMALEQSNLLEAFIRGAQELIRGGVDGIATTCGFLALYQRELTQACSVPVATSALLQIPMVQRLLPPGRRVGIMCFRRESLGPRHLSAIGVPEDTPVAGMPENSHFARSIKKGQDDAPFEMQRAEVLEAARRLLAENPGIGAIVSECANMTPFSADIAEACGVPVYDGVTLVNWFRAGLRPRRFPQG